MGDVFDHYANGESLVLRWDGARWRQDWTQSHTDVSLQAAARSRRQVWTAGSGFRPPAVVKRWNGGRWQWVRGPATHGGYFKTIAVRSDADVWFLGGSTGRARPLVQRWDGSRMHVMPAPPIKGTILASAVRGRTIWAGGYVGTEPEQPFIARYGCR